MLAEDAGNVEWAGDEGASDRHVAAVVTRASPYPSREAHLY